MQIACCTPRTRQYAVGVDRPEIHHPPFTKQRGGGESRNSPRGCLVRGVQRLWWVGVEKNVGVNGWDEGSGLVV